MVMEAVQSFALAPWKSAKFLYALIDHLQRMSFTEMIHTPLLQQHMSEIKEKQEFKGMSVLFYAQMCIFKLCYCDYSV